MRTLRVRDNGSHTFINQYEITFNIKSIKKLTNINENPDDNTWAYGKDMIKNQFTNKNKISISKSRIFILNIYEGDSFHST